jgi:hypothetical protein
MNPAFFILSNSRNWLCFIHLRLFCLKYFLKNTIELPINTGNNYF